MGVGRSRVVRAVGTIEVFAILAPGYESELPADLGAILRDAVASAANDADRGVWLVAGEGDDPVWEPYEPQAVT